jgi:hypothetical protein
MEAAAPGSQRPAVLRRAALSALGATVNVVRLALGEPAAHELLQLLQERLQSLTLGKSAADATCAATALGLACRALASAAAHGPGSNSSLPVAADKQLNGGLGSLLATLAALLPDSGDSMFDAAAAVGLPLPEVPPTAAALPDRQVILSSVALAAATAVQMSDTPFAQLLPGVVQQLQQLLLAEALPAAAPALCALLAAAAAAAYRAKVLDNSDVSSTLRVLLSLSSVNPRSSNAAVASDGSLPGAAALAAARLITSAVQHGFAAMSPDESPAGLAQRLLALINVAGKLQHSLAAKRQAATGLAVLLRAGAVETDTAEYRPALAALERLAFSDSDPRARHACAQPLAALCHAARRKGVASGAAGASGSAGKKGLGQLAPDGALRPLLEAAIEGRWMLGRKSCLLFSCVVSCHAEHSCMHRPVPCVCEAVV